MQGANKNAIIGTHSIGFDLQSKVGLHQLILPQQCLMHVLLGHIML